MFSSLKNENVALISALVVLVAGFCLDLMIDPPWDFFQRSGAIVVAIGIAASLSDLKSIYNQKLEARLKWLEDNRMVHDIVKSDEEIAEKAPGTTDHVIEKTKSEFDSLTKRAGAVDLRLLVGGTLVWGFGDLLIDFVKWIG